MGHLNVEIKAKCRDHDFVRKILRSKSADFKGMDHQVDTYFKVNSGRLKLREGNIENFLIYYDRENKEGPKESKIILFKSDPSSTLKEILVNANGILVVVDKKREIYFIENVKFHIDIVQDLGSFIEIEAIDKDGSLGKDKLYSQCQEYMKLLGISDSDLISVSYSDLMLKIG
jgi:predicted adenylyl cyclase CyaB